ncbi:MAG: DNA polymerase I [Candidatus Latescibacteria bacterium]|nr:DNA polymerase I [Candidatus Latescibacterota bacterium]
MPETLYLIDAFAQIFRAYYAIRTPMHSPSTGEPTQAVFGFTGMLLKLFSQFQPHYAVVAIDSPGKTFRDDLYSQYKATRRETPEDLLSQVPRVFQVVEGFGIPVIGQPGLEADDIIATLTQRVLDNPSWGDLHIRIVSKDKDLEQLLGERVSLFDIHTDTTTDVAALLENKGITPAQVIDLLTLMGDTSDNVPGVEGIGPKTAAQLIQQYGSLDGLLANLGQLKGKRRENIEKALDTLPLSRALVTLKRDADFPFSLEDARVRPPDPARLLPLFQQLGFNRFRDEVQRLAPPSAATPARQADLFSAPPAGEARTAAEGHYEAITTLEQLHILAAMLRAQPLISVDTETTGLEREALLCGLSFAWEEGRGVYVPLRSPEPEEHLSPAAVLEVLGPLLADPALPKCGHNLKFDAGVLLNAGVQLRGVVCDSLLASILIDPSRPSHKLDELALIHFNHRMIPITELIGEGGTMDQVPLDKIAVYAAEDADLSLRLCRLFLPKLDELGMGELMRQVEAPLAAVLARMEARGILCDPGELRRQGQILGQRVEELRRQVWELAGGEFQLESTQQLAEVLFKKLGFPPGKRTKTGYSTDITVLEKLAAREDRSDPRTGVPRLVIEYRQLAKLISTYLGNLEAAISPRDHRIHSTFHQLVTATGRLASQNPNLQNIPVRTEVGRQIRRAFVAPPGQLLICADYSQIEIRLLAHLSEDPALIEAFVQDQDIHAAVAAQVFGVPLDQVTRPLRDQAKTINFGIIYGITAFGLAQRVEGMDLGAATALIADYKRRFPGIESFLQKCVQQALDQGYVATLMGRRRAIPELRERDHNLRSLGERLAINSVVQGSAADLIKAAMVRVQDRIDREDLPLELLLQIHDELVFEAPADQAPVLAEMICREMEAAMTLKVPLRAEAGIGPDWMSAK